MNIVLFFCVLWIYLKRIKFSTAQLEKGKKNLKKKENILNAGTSGWTW